MLSIRIINTERWSRFFSIYISCCPWCSIFDYWNSIQGLTGCAVDDRKKNYLCSNEQNAIQQLESEQRNAWGGAWRRIRGAVGEGCVTRRAVGERCVGRWGRDAWGGGRWMCGAVGEGTAKAETKPNLFFRIYCSPVIYIIHLNTSAQPSSRFAHMTSVGLGGRFRGKYPSVG